jgi:endonuclease I
MALLHCTILAASICYMKKFFFIFLVLNINLLLAQPPAGYYTAAANLNCAALKTALKTITTNGNNPQCYSPCLWNQYNVYDTKPRQIGPGTSATVIYDIYSNKPGSTDPYEFTPGTGTGGQQDQGSGGTAEGQYYNREHTVPQSWFNGNTAVPGPTTDYLIVYPTDKYVNSKRGNLPYGEVATASQTFLNGTRTGTSSVAGITGNVFEPIDSFKGDVARSFLYFVTRYEDNIGGWSSNAPLVFDNSTFPSVTIPYLKLMLKWNALDPVSQKEIDRNNGSYPYQGNRNPFIDSPQFVARIWNSTCAGLSALPVDVLFFYGKLNGDKINLTWEVGTEINVDRYEIERSYNSSSYTTISTIKASGSKDYVYSDDANTSRGRRVYYRIKKIDKDGSYSYTDVFSMQVPMNTKFAVYPNPASDVIHLHFGSSVTDKVDIALKDISGMTVLHITVLPNAGQASISTQFIQSGTYLVSATIGSEQFVQKVIVMK